MALTDRTLTKTSDEGDVQLLKCPFCGLDFELANIERPNHFEGNCAVYHDLDSCPYSGVSFENIGDPVDFYDDPDCPAYA